VLGADLPSIEQVGKEIEEALRSVPGTRAAFAERVTGGYYVDIRPRRDQVARYGLKLEDLNGIIETAIGGDPISEAVEGRARVGVTARFAREFRDDVEKIKRLPVMTANRTQVQLGQLADVTLSQGPGMIRDENGFLAGYVYADIEGRDQGGYVEEAKRTVARKVHLPPGVSLLWSGQYELLAQANRRLWVMVPLALCLVFLLIFLNTRSVTETGLILLAVPFSLVGAFWFLWALGFNTSVAVWVGMIALAGLDAETGVVMMLYLNLAYRSRKAAGKMKSRVDLREAVVEGAAKRVRPKLMTVCAAWFGLVPILFSSGIGSDVMKRVAAPMVGGILTSFLLELLVYPVLFAAWKWQCEVSPERPRGFWAWVKSWG
jgi:Cu(I)/Ag(I) efflux system membrane protein CusA/SilA